MGTAGTIHQAVAVTGMRRPRSVGLRKTTWSTPSPPPSRALNLIRLDAWWDGHPLDRTRVSHLARLDGAKAARASASVARACGHAGVREAVDPCGAVGIGRVLAESGGCGLDVEVRGAEFDARAQQGPVRSGPSVGHADEV
ncbi:hypothetical protein GCM10027168_10570 [Streptomyces capparidis]